MRLPYGVQADEAGRPAGTRLHPADRVTVDIQHQARRRRLAAEFGDGARRAALSDFVKGNVKARSAMVAQYAIAGQHGLLVVGTDHAAEAVTGFFTKFGDGGADIRRSPG